MAQALKEAPEQAPAHRMDAMTLVSQAVSNGAAVDQVDKLIELVKFNDQREALRAFNQAFTAAQAEFPAVRKTKSAHNSRFAPLDEEVKQLRPVLMKHGLSFRHEVTENTDKTVSVRCILAHEAGHSESATLTGPADTSGSKNGIQAIGSTVTYLRRYTFEAVTGLVTTDQDDDAQGAIPKISDDDAKDIEARIKQYGIDRKAFFGWLKSELKAGSLAELTKPTLPYVLEKIEAKKPKEPANG